MSPQLLLLFVGSVTALTEIRNFDTTFGFETVRIIGPLTVKVVYGALFANITAPTADLIRSVQTISQDKTLIVRFDGNPSDDVEITINVFSKSQKLSVAATQSSVVNVIAQYLLETAIIIKGGSSVTADVISTLVKSTIFGAGVMTLTGQCGDSELEVRGSGQFNAMKLAAARTAIDVRGVGEFIVNTGAITGIVRGSAIVRYVGSPLRMEITNYGSTMFTRI